MSSALEEVVGTAIIDPEFRAGLLNGQRARLIAQFKLTPDEQQAVLSIRAESLQAFACQLYTWLEGRHLSVPMQSRIM
jgi:hypothetical protein